jgi:hypothetical protein
VKVAKRVSQIGFQSPRQAGGSAGGDGENGSRSRQADGNDDDHDATLKDHGFDLANYDAATTLAVHSPEENSTMI